MMSLYDAGSHETLKGAVHGACVTIVGLMAAYNTVAYRERGDRHLLVNAVVYGCAVAFESYQIGRHCWGPQAEQRLK